MIIANSPLYPAYQNFLALPIHISIGDLTIEKPLLLWINKGLMTIFFLLLALETKREVLQGELYPLRQFSIPLAATIGSAVIPISIFSYLNYGSDAIQGWPIAITTDIGLTMGIIVAMGKVVPPPLKVFVTTVGLMANILAIILTTFFHSKSFSPDNLLLVLVAFLLLILFNRRDIKYVTLYLLIGIFMWGCVANSNLYGALVGIIIGFTIPLRTSDPSQKSPLKRLEVVVYPWVVFFIIPLFVLCNSAIPLVHFQLSFLSNSLTIAIIISALFGKMLGVFSFTYTANKLGLGQLFPNITWLQLLGASILTGAGFSVSLYINSMIFYDTANLELVRSGIVLASILAMIIGCSLIYIGYTKNPK
jgi:NhaA family Na+:H+ antiporter